MTEIKKSYNPLTMWGGWVGLAVGAIGTLIYIMGAPSLLRDLLGGPIQMLNPLLWIFQWPALPLVLLTPIVLFFEGWGVHSIFRKLSKRDGVKLLIAIVALAIIGFTFFYLQAKKDFQTANPYYNYDVGMLLSKASDESIDIDTRLTMLETMEGKISGMSLDERKTLSAQLTSLGDRVSKSGQLSDTNKERMALRIVNLQKMLAN